jgi:hypothetical protein
MHVIATAMYEKQAKRLLTVRERIVAEAEIVVRPDAWPVIQVQAERARRASQSAGEASGVVAG